MIHDSGADPVDFLKGMATVMETSMSKSSKRLCIQRGAGHNFHNTHKINISRR